MIKAITVGLTSCAFATAVWASDAIFTPLFSNKAIKGADVVAYWQDHKLEYGKDTYVTSYKGADWYFATQDHLDAFKASPESYEPQYGGYCAYAMADGKKVKIDPEAWTIRDKKLYLNYSPKIQEKWEESPDDYIQKADLHWKFINP